MNPHYSNLLSPLKQAVHETKNSYLYITERHLQAMWFEQKYFKNLKTIQGDSVVVISPGIWNSEAGPDFKKAHLIIGGKEVKGDVEIHLSEAGWEQHSHHNDPRYNEVVFHLALWGSNKIISTMQGHQILRTILEPYLTIPLQRIINYIDLDLYPYKKFLGAGKCATELFQTLESKKIDTFFRQAAEWRLSKKRAFLLSRTPNHAEALIAGIALGLGYKNNAQSFLDLFLLLQSRRKETFDDLLTYALGVTGFFDARYQEKWGNSTEYSKLLCLFGGVEVKRDLVKPEVADDVISSTPPFQQNNFRIPLRLNQIRPMNHPIRRMVYLIKLLQLPQLDQFYDQMIACWKSHDKKHMIHNMTKVIPTFEDSYWNSHYLFEQEPKNTFIPFIGNDLKEELLINAFLPLLYHEIEERANPSEIEDFRLFYSTFSPLKSGKTKYLIHRFFGDSQKGTVLNKAFTEQGAYQVHKDFCTHYEASCDGCPFVERYKSFFK